MSVIGERLVTGGNGRGQSAPEGRLKMLWIVKDFQPLLMNACPRAKGWHGYD
jgi:hypothetical protein